MKKPSRNRRIRPFGLALLLAAVLLPPATVPRAAAQPEPMGERFVVSDARGHQSAPRVDGKWIVYERRSDAPPTATPTATAAPPTATSTPPPATETATPTPTATPTATPGTPSALLPSGGADARYAKLTAAVQAAEQGDIRAHNLETGEDRRLTDGANTRHPDVSGSHAVWSELGDDGNWGIVVYHLEDRSVVRRIDRDGNQELPAIAGRLVVWQDSRRGNWDIRAYDLDQRREFWVSDSSEDETRPAIDGGLVAFERDDRIWYRDLETNRLQRIDGVDGYEPSVSGDRIVFRSGDRDSERNAGIYVFDGRDGSLTQISTTLDGRRGSPRISGDLVVWWDRRRGDRDIFAYDLATRTEFRVADADDDQDQPDVSAGAPSVVVWTDHRGSDNDVRGARVTLAPAAQPATPTPVPAAPPAPIPAPVDPSPPAPRDARYFWETGFRIDDDGIWEYFQLRGGVKNFGFPTSRTFPFLGFTTQFFQRHVVQVGPTGPRLLNLLDPELMPYTQINTSTFPAYDPSLAGQAPPVGSPDYDTRIVEFIRQYAPDGHAGAPVRFFETFAAQVNFATSFPSGIGDAALLPGINLELAGSVTSHPTADPNNAGFIYQRFQRVIFHYDAGCGCTQPILLADYFKSILMGQGLPPDLAEQAQGSHFFGQYDNAAPNGVNRPAELPETDLRFAFEPQ